MNKIKKKAGNLQYTHLGFVSRGASVDTRLELIADLDPEQDYTKVVQGSVISLNSAGKFGPGVQTSDIANRIWNIPCICIKNYFDEDVTTGREGPAGFRNHTVYSPVGGKVTAVPLTAGYEIETSEFVDATFTPGQAIIAATDSENLGKITGATSSNSDVPGGTTPYLGFVSSVPAVRDNASNPQRPTTIRFLSNYIPNTQA